MDRVSKASEANAKNQNTYAQSFKIKLKVPGNTNISSGDVISFETLTYPGPNKNATDIDPYLSGNYLVTSVGHLLHTTEHITELICAKDSVGKGYAPEPKELLNNEKDESDNDFSTNDVDVILT